MNTTPAPTYQVIKAEQVKAGYAVRFRQTKDGIETTQKLTVHAVEFLGAVISLQTKEGGEVVLAASQMVELLPEAQAQA